MTTNAHSKRTTAGRDNDKRPINAPFRVPPFWPDDVDLWFKMLELQFKTFRITGDQKKYQAVIANLDKSHLRLIRDVLDASPATGRYAYVKKELMKRFGESDAKRLRHVIENEQMGDRKPSQFYRVLRSKAINSLTDDVILIVWESRLPSRVRSFLASVQIKDPETRIQIADIIYESTRQSGQIVAASAGRLPTRTHPPGQDSGLGDAMAAVINSVTVLLARIDAFMSEIRALVAQQKSNEHRIRTAFKEDLNATAAEMVYGTDIRLPTEFFAPTMQQANTKFANRLKE
ncbi:uncharacterized protein LOC117207393 [Bombus bifarius]|uniref:Uncharacterized protein LOC117207393 n=1 Tax=Bombus bifarius TaxID=103933 RepID=A0A6P8MLM1_9HYME|nr:uncharacterized protein LOC117207393 [Bombus bifarius]